jgi:uncharacterized peroxidase-related enzyme
MRLPEVEKGDGFFYRILIRFISMVSGMRLPDAARIVMYHQNFYGKPMTSWTHAVMRGESNWSVGERELVAAMVASWNQCPFCIDAHGSIASLELGDPLVKSALADFNQADISSELRTTLVFLKKLVQSPDDLSVEDTQTVLDNNVSPEALEDAIAVAALFSITVRCANAFNFAMLDSKDSDRAAKRMLKQGYVFGKSKMHGRSDHQVFAEALNKSVLEGTGKTEVALRQSIAKRVTEHAQLEEPYNTLALLEGNASYKVTDELIKEVVTKSGSEKAAFELIVAAAVSAGLYRWHKGLNLLRENG